MFYLSYTLLKPFLDQNSVYKVCFIVFNKIFEVATMRIEQEMIRSNTDRHDEIKYIIQSIDVLTNNKIEIARLENTDTYLLIDQNEKVFKLEKFGVYIPNIIIKEKQFLDKVAELEKGGYKRLLR